MNESPTSSRGSRLLKPTLIGVTAALVGLALTTTQSFWMDEGNTVIKAIMPTFREFKVWLLHLGGSDVQMPVYMFMVWCWEKLGAESEYAFRLINLPWVAIGALALSRFKWWPLCFLLSPFLWFYGGELRPYAMQIAGGALATLGLIKVSQSKAREDDFEGIHVTALASLLLASSSLTGAVWAFGVGLGVLILRTDWLKARGFWLRALPWAVAVLPLAAYYGFTLLQGYRATSLGGGGLMGILFGFYELIGMVGLGPGRDELRADLAGIVRFFPVLIPAALLTIVAWVAGVWSWKKNLDLRRLVAGVAVVGIPLVVFVTISIAMDFRVLGRHLSPLLPAVLLPLCLGLDLGRRRPVIMIAAVGCLCFAASSSFLVRFAQRHERDDYRTASAVAFEAMDEGRRVLWKADMNATRYYAWRRGGLPYVLQIQPLETDRPPSLLSADLVVINRPDIHEADPNYKAVFTNSFFNLVSTPHGFEVWDDR